MGKGKEWTNNDPIVIKGFEYFVELGTSRKVATALAKDGYKVSHHTVARWVDRFGWTDKRNRLLALGPEASPEYSAVMARDDTAINFVDSDLPLDRHAAQAVKNYYAKILFDMTEDFIHRFQKGEVAIEKFNDFEKAVRLMALLKGVDLTQVNKPKGSTVNQINIYGNMSDDDVRKKIAALRGGNNG
jgi:hypothetical protein